MTHPIRLLAGTVTALAIASVAVAGPVLAVPAWSAAGVPRAGGSVGLRPANPDHADPANGSYFTPKMRPGGVTTEQVIVTNDSEGRIDVIISAVDGLTGQTSGAVYGNRQDRLKHAGSWVTPARGQLSLPAHGEVKVGFTIRVPRNAAVGDHLAGLAVEDAHPAASGGKFSITQVLRTVIGINIQVPGKATFHPALSTLGIEKLAGPNVAAIKVGMSNDGQAVGKPKLTIALVGPAGYRVTLSRDLDTLLPGDPINYPFTWRDTLAKGQYKVTATLTGGGAEATMSRTVQVGDELKGASTLTEPAAAAGKGGGGLPKWALGAIISGAVAIGVAGGIVGPAWAGGQSSSRLRIRNRLRHRSRR
jgi:hypothetical protein